MARLNLVKRLVAWLAIIALLGGTWAQASAGNLNACAGSRAVMSVELLLHDAASDAVAAPEHGSNAVELLAADSDWVTASKAELAKSATADCAKAQSCTSSPALLIGSLLLKDWKHAVQSTPPAAVRGRSLDPELSPPNQRL